MTLPEPDTTDLRAGAPFNDQLLALLPLVGEWRGAGSGAVASTGAEFSYGQQVSFSHDGRPFLVYESRTWLIDAAGDLIRLAFRESGFWRMGAGPDDIEIALATAAGIVEVFAGIAGDNQWEVASTGLAHTATARPVIGERRLYALVGDTLAYATELHLPTADGFEPHLSAQLERVRA
jgi:THAP4-like, heme-binding beta-barrel domain